MEKLTPYQTVLVLNASYEPIHFTNWKRAIILLLKEKAQVVSKSVIRLLKYVHIPIAKIVYERPPKSLIYKRDNNKCQYCGATKALTIDHVIPKSKGGKDTWDNLVVACSSCNSKKGDTFLEDTNMKLTRKPKAPINKSMIQLVNASNAEWQEYIFG
jgi:DNA-directed RNA polymerase subunit RPC12/RpoP